MNSTDTSQLCKVVTYILTGSKISRSSHRVKDLQVGSSHGSVSGAGDIVPSSSVLDPVGLIGVVYLPKIPNYV